MRDNDLFTIEEFAHAFHPSKEAVEEGVKLLLSHVEELLVLASAFIQDGAHLEEYRGTDNELLETASVKTKQALDAIMIAEGLLECSCIGTDGSQKKMHALLLTLKKKIDNLGVDEDYHPESLQFIVSPTKNFGIDSFDTHLVFYYREKEEE